MHQSGELALEGAAKKAPLIAMAIERQIPHVAGPSVA